MQEASEHTAIGKNPVFPQRKREKNLKGEESGGLWGEKEGQTGGS